MNNFSHLHVHTQYSLLDGAAGIKNIYKKAIADGQPAVAITDHGNMFGVFEFVAEAYKHKLNPDNKDDNTLLVKPIIGCEFYMVDNRLRRQFTKDDKDKRYHQLLLAKNAVGYKNLSKLCSLGYIEGLYSKWPRIDKELIMKYHDGLIATTCCLGAEVPQAILNDCEAAAEKIFKWWLDLFGEDYYVELQRHNLKEQDTVNEVLFRFAEKYNVKIIATNDSHYVDEKDSNTQDILLCLNTGEKQATPIAMDEESKKGFRFGFPNNQFYFKTQEEMRLLFKDVPQAIDNTNEIVDKIELLKLERDILLPNYEIPVEFLNQDDYLHHLTYLGAKERYPELTPEVEERLNFELLTIKTMGFAGYFLIVADFIKAGREMGVMIGPGRGSAAGSAVAYCVGITNIDPIKYNLLFERFLNPDRKSMPDIDTDFDDENRQKVIDYVVEKYGRNQVAQIVTYQTIAARSSIKDVARVLDLPLAESNMMAKLVPERPGTSLKRVLLAELEGKNSLTDKEKENLDKDDIENVKKLRALMAGNDLAAQVLKDAIELEGSIRGTGVHAAGVIIAPGDLTELMPMATAKDSDLLVTQIDGEDVEKAGALKMDFLGLKNLTILRDCLILLKQNRNINVDIDQIPLDDELTFSLYQKAETNGTFQFESSGMQKHLLELKPDKFGDLIAMNALFRPGPMAYIPSYIKRKHGKEEITYDLPEMKEILEETFGITVYQEQVMLLSQKIANFSKGDADILRKAMGKKQKHVLDKMLPRFLEGGEANGHPKDKLMKIWGDWENFAQYAFNKSHSTCYAYVAYQTSYLKAHYPAEYMAAVLTNVLGNIDRVSFYMEECKRMGIKVLGPDVNESQINFSVNANGDIRFGLGAVKGVGETAATSILEERTANGPFTDIYDFTTRVNLRSVNKRTFDSLAQSGGFDSIENLHRSQYVDVPEGETISFNEKLIKFGGSVQNNQSNLSVSLFGESHKAELQKPKAPTLPEWPLLVRLNYEKELVGLYISGHPLDEYKLEMKYYPHVSLLDFKIEKDRTKYVAGLITKCDVRKDKRGNDYCRFTIEDFEGSMEFTLWSESYKKYANYLQVAGDIVMMKVSGKSRFGNDAIIEPDIKDMYLLAEVHVKIARTITIKAGMDFVSERLIEKISKLGERHKGSAMVKMEFYDPQDKIQTVRARLLKVNLNPSNELLKELEDMKEIEFFLN